MAKTIQIERRSLATQVADALRELIMSNAYRQGQQLRQDDLAKRLGVSHIPVREAFQLLEAEGLITNIPYKGAAPAYVDLIAGHIELLLSNIAGTVPQVKAGRLRAVAVSAAKRAPILPGVPSIGETYPGYDLTTWMGIFVPSGTPQVVVSRLNGDFAKVLARQDVRERIESLGSEVIAGSAADLGALVDRETRLYAKIIKSANIQPQ